MTAYSVTLSKHRADREMTLNLYHQGEKAKHHNTHATKVVRTSMKPCPYSSP